MIIFRADVSPVTGLQYVHLCAQLASVLKNCARVMLCVREDKRATKFLADRGIPFSLVKDPAKFDCTGADTVIFANATLSSHDAALLQKAKKAGGKTVQIVSAGAEPQPVDIVFSPLARTENALLHHKFRHFNKAKRKYRKNIKNIFVNLGDLLPYRDLRGIVDILHRLHYRMKIAPGLAIKKSDKRSLLKIYPGIHFCGKSESPARAYFEADLALISPGEEALEAACVGTPTLYMSSAAGQETLADAWAAKGLGVRIPSLADFSVEAVRDAIAPLTLERREQMGSTGKMLVDGLGVQRFFKILKENGIIV